MFCYEALRVGLSFADYFGRRETSVYGPCRWEYRGRPFFAPPGIPPERLRALRDGFAKMMKDPDVIADAKSKGLEPSLMTGEQIEALGRDIGTLPPDLIERMKPLLER